jgi:hypothetical protein
LQRSACVCICMKCMNIPATLVKKKTSCGVLQRSVCVCVCIRICIPVTDEGCSITAFS